MKNQLTKSSLTIILLLFSVYAFSQKGTVSGTLTDSSGMPLPGVNVLIKNTIIGTQTDFDGNYTINCSVGDILVYTYVGLKTIEVTVGLSMFNKGFKIIDAKQIPVKNILSNAYSDALKDRGETEIIIPSFEDSEKIYNKNNYFQFNRIKDIEVTANQVELTYFNPDIYYEIGFNTVSGFQFVKNNKLPVLQKTYSQGVPQNGANTFLGAETSNPFSYGPKINTLEFDDSNYEYDANGQLVVLGNGNGQPAIPYNNNIFNTTFKTQNYLFFNVSTDIAAFGIDYTSTKNKDLFEREKLVSNDLVLSYKSTPEAYKKLHWDTFVKYGSKTNNQPNINGFHNNLLLNLWTTPVSFSNSQGTILSNNTQRSFSPSLFNNPEWLLSNNINSDKNELFVASLKNEINVSDDIKLESRLNYSLHDNSQAFGLVRNTVGFEDGYKSLKTIKKNNFNAVLVFDFEDYTNDKIEVSSVTNFTSEHLDYSLYQANGFDVFTFSNPQSNSLINKSLNKNTFRLLNKVSYTVDDIGAKFTLLNNSYISSIQNNKWFLPTFQVTLNLNNLFDFYDIGDFHISAITSYDVNDSALLYANQSHNSLTLLPEESLRYKSNNDLFLSKNLQLEEKKNLDLSTSFRFWALDASFDFGFTYFNSKTKGSVFPVITESTFELKNSANIKNSGIEFNLDADVYSYGSFQYNSSIVFSTYKSKVTKLLTEDSRIPIAGFSTTSKYLIVGKPAGVIVGSAYARDSQNNIIIDSDGFPLVDNELKVIGDPTPDFNMGFSNEFKWKKIKLNFVIDFQKGGDVWNGTQNVLNYFGASQQSAKQRTIVNYIFNGVDQQGNPNTTPVDFASPNNGLSGNRFVRYGFEGVAEDAIVDGSYINIKSIDLSYQIFNNNDHRFFRSLTFTVYANNLFTWTKFKNRSPYGNLYNSASGQGLNFFNTPITSEVGFKINLKI